MSRFLWFSVYMHLHTQSNMFTHGSFTSEP